MVSFIMGFVVRSGKSWLLICLRLPGITSSQQIRAILTVSSHMQIALSMEKASPLIDLRRPITTNYQRVREILMGS